MVRVPRSLWHEPRPVGVSPIGRLDWLLIGAYATATVVEGVVRPGMDHRVLATLLALTLAPALLHRRHHPLPATLVGWGAAGISSLLELTLRTGDLGPTSMLAVLILLFSLVRWGSGREVIVGGLTVAAVSVLGMQVAVADPSEVFGGVVLLLLVAALAALARFRADLWAGRQREIRNAERSALARDLHDTVAHHVSAIVVQAQAGAVVARSSPERAVDVLAAIEAEGSRTLAEMRSMVRLLREEDAAELAPGPGVADLPALARADASPAVEIRVHDSVSRLARPVDAAVYRLAQEALTNALRHARGATRIRIDVRFEGEDVSLRVADDGRSAPLSIPSAGFGLLGMRERAAILGGSVSAGPAPDGGWVVEAVLPRGGSR